MPDDEATEVRRDRIADVDKNLAFEVAGFLQHVGHCSIGQSQDHDIRKLDGGGYASCFHVRSQFRGEGRSLCGIMMTNHHVRACFCQHSRQARTHISGANHSNRHVRSLLVADEE